MSIPLSYPHIRTAADTRATLALGFRYLADSDLCPGCSTHRMMEMLESKHVYCPNCHRWYKDLGQVFNINANKAQKQSQFVKSSLLTRNRINKLLEEI